MSLHDALDKMREAYDAVATAANVTDIRAFLIEHGLPSEEDLTLQLSLLGTLVGDLTERGVDPSALGAAMATLGAHCERVVAAAKEEPGAG